MYPMCIGNRLIQNVSLRKVDKIIPYFTLSNIKCFSNIEHKPALLETLSVQYKQHTGIIQKIINKPTSNLSDNIFLWNNFIKTLKQHGFQDSDCFQIIYSDPQVLSIAENDLSTVLMRWHQCQLGSEWVKLLILNNPSFMFVPITFIEKRMPILQIFARKPKSLVLLLLQCPNVLTEQWEQVQAKIDYMTNVMRVDKTEILQSQALNKSLEHIKLRYQLLLKCGMYQIRSPYEHKRVKNEKSAFRNPHLKRIVDNEDISFARKICKISHEEYEAFRDLVEEEFSATSEDELISDSGSESD